MFRQRLLTSLVLIPLVLLAIYYASFWILGSIVLLLTMVCGWEWSQLIPTERLTSKLCFIALLLVAVGLSWYGLEYCLLVGLSLWVLILLAVLTFPTSQNS